jgi:hypothetical protein
VKWGGGGIYVTGSQWYLNANLSSDVWTNKIKSKSEEDLTLWEETYSVPHGGEFMVSGFPGSGTGAMVGFDSATGERGSLIFVLGGQQDRKETGGSAAAMILTSTDGVDWTPQVVGSYGDVYLVTWNDDENVLYAGMQDYSEVEASEGRDVFDVVLRSTDGLEWTRTERKLRGLPFESPLEKYCSDRIRDVHGHKVPTSIFGYDGTTDVLIAPDPISISWGVTYPAGEDIEHGHRLKITRGPGNDNPGESTVALPDGMDRVWAVAHEAGIWQAAGGTETYPPKGIIATSVDAGLTWETTLEGEPGTLFMMVAAGSKGGSDAGL